MTKQELWIVEIDQGGINWTPIAYCVSEKQARDHASAPHILAFGKPARVRKYGTHAPLRTPAELPEERKQS